MSAPVTWPMPAVVELDRLGPLAGSISLGAGQSTGIHPLPDHEGWLVKRYLQPADPGTADRLSWMIDLPAAMSPDDRALAATSTSWPVAAVLDGDRRTIGCVLPKAPAKFRSTLSPADGGEHFLEVDWLARTGAAFARRGLPAPAYGDRVRVCRDLISVATLLGRYGLVYSDWSYSNAFYSTADHTAYVIDIDGCGRRRMPNIFQPNWDDPLTPRSMPADAQTDRYRVALLVARLLTGERAAVDALHALDDLPDPGTAEVLRDCLLATDRMHRPAPTTLLSVLDGRPYLRMPIARMPLPARPARPAPPVPHAVTVTRPPVPVPVPAPPLRNALWAALVVVAILAILLASLLAAR